MESFPFFRGQDRRFSFRTIIYRIRFLLPRKRSISRPERTSLRFHERFTTGIDEMQPSGFLPQESWSLFDPLIQLQEAATSKERGCDFDLRRRNRNDSGALLCLLWGGR